MEPNNLILELSTLELNKLVFLIHKKHIQGQHYQKRLKWEKEFEKLLQAPYSLLLMPQQAGEGIVSKILAGSLLI